MGAWFNNLRELFRENPRLWIVLACALVIGVGTVWYAYGGFSLQIGRFFAVENPIDNSGGSTGATPTISAAAAGPERCPGRPVQPPTWVPDSALEWLCDRDAGEDGDLDRQCVSWNEANKRGSGGEFGYKSRRYAEGQISGGPPVQFPWYCVEFFDHCPEGGGNTWVVFGSGDSAVCKYSEASATASVAPSGVPLPAQLSVVCGANQNTLTWATPLPSGSNASAINKISVAPGGAQTSEQIGINLGTNPSSYTDTNVRSGYLYQYTFKNHVSVRSNTVTCSTASASIAPTPVATASPPPVPSAAPGEAVRCAPLSRTVQLRQIARLEASGGNGIYAWNVTQGGSIEEGGNQYIGVSYNTIGRKTLRLNSSGTSSFCVIEVVSGVVPTPTSSARALIIQKTGRNTTTGDPTERSAVTVFPGQTALFKVRTTNNGPVALNNVMVKDAVPPGMSYLARSTRVEGQSILAESVTTTGLSVGRLDPGETVTVEWSALANLTAFIVSGPNQTAPTALVTADTTADAIAQMSVTVYGSGVASGAGSVQTGPGDTVLAALFVAAVLTLLYGGYTRSASYRRHDAQSVSREREPMDFRS